MFSGFSLSQEKIDANFEDNLPLAQTQRSLPGNGICEVIDT
jgi:hypothetical protein